MPFMQYGDISAPPTYQFSPQKDITTYELAQLTPLLIAAWKDENFSTIVNNKKLASSWTPKIEELTDDLKRHFCLG